MEAKRKSNYSVEHRRAQNRLAQRRFRQRQSQQKAKADQPPQQALETPISATDNPSDIFKFSAGTWPAPPSPIKSPGGSIGFGVNCLHGGANGLIGIQNFINMDDLKDSPLSTLLAGPSPSISNTDSAEHTISSSDQNSNSKHPSPLASKGESSINHRATPDSVDTNSPPKALTDKSTPASAGSVSALFPRTTQCDNADPGCLSVLHIAAQKGHHGIMRVLLQQDIDCDEIDSDGLTSLIHATIGGHEDVVTLLLMHGARIDKADHQGRSALHFAVSYRREVILKILLDYCMSDQGFIDAYDSSGRTPLHIAVDTAFEEGVQILLQRGASVHCKTRKTAAP
ncbi:hypothetical protein PCG10_001787 [Penicillium crustosum]|uniref:BZIP domain-containing protein n=1 Tax=Penicillium crustosum TaxID=36656 RepID=A0A9P5GF81_PENCR|nr:uncharacterized protein N7487_008667 [Penicillium crustosum]KAF7516826.1 hypothetical protein PCG10_001787 [Penicillium crustosum]KAJ5402771.1 hypothetical protein N7487_008667 [Penicillium crustosum]